MLNDSIRILNFDDSVIKQKKLFSQYKTEIINLTDLGPRLRYWMSQKTKQALRSRIEYSSENTVTFLGSGDFHQVTNILIDKVPEPLSLIVFDFHPDWDILPPRLGCGSWVTESLKNKKILKILLIGISSADISTGSLQSGNLASLKNNRLEIYPYAHIPSRVFLRKVPESICIRQEKGHFYRKIYWNELKAVNLREFFLTLLKRLPTKQVYLSIDKDCLRREYSITNWEEGRLSLEELLLMLRLIRENLDIVGADVVGDYSKIAISGKFKKIFSRLDHPRENNAANLSAASITAVNEETNLRILQALL